MTAIRPSEVEGPVFDQRHAKETGRPFADLTARVRAAGLLDPRPRYYTAKLIGNTAIFAVGLAAFFAIGNSWWQLLVAVWMGFYGGQSAFMWHDAGHKAMFRNKQIATAVGRFHANLVNGVSYEWWVSHHNRHHSFPNHLDDDPDIGRRTIIFRLDQFASRSRWGRFVVRYQSVLFFVLLVFEAIKLHRTGFKAVLDGTLKKPRVEALLLVAHLAIYLGVVFTVLSPLTAVCFVAVQQAVVGFYFGMIFAPNHKGMPVRDAGDPEPDWLERQVLTSRNIKGGGLMTYLYGGLNYQVEHHLFPTMPLLNLDRAGVITKEFCAERGIPYHETGFLRAYGEVAGFLHDVSAPVRAGEVA